MIDKEIVLLKKSQEKKFSQLLFEKRMELQLSQKAMAKEMGIKPRMYSDYETGKYDNTEGDVRRKKHLQILASLKPADSTENFNNSLTPTSENNTQLSASEKDLRIAYLEMALKAAEEKYDIAIELAEVRKQRILDLEEKLTLRTLTPKQKQKESISEPIKKDGH